MEQQEKMLEKLLKKLRRRLERPEGETELLTELLEDAECYICAYTGRETVPGMLAGVQVELACVMYNRRGMQGETGHTEGGISVTAEGLPEEIRRALDPYRRAKVV